MKTALNVFLLCVLLVNCTLGQTEKPLLTPATTSLLANEVCDCLKKEDGTAINGEKAKKCFMEVIFN